MMRSSGHTQSGRTGTLRETVSHPIGSAGHGAGPASRTAATCLRPQPWWSYLELAALPAAPSCARLHTKQVLWEWGLGSVSEDAELIVSELVTNAMQVTNAQGLDTPVRLWLTGIRPGLLIEVWDGDAHPPRPGVINAGNLPSAEGESGRGLLLVASLSRRCGWYPERALGGKMVWGEVA
jgi:anti-sigma regulatory factor (Ser/Thr protein kinase)